MTYLKPAVATALSARARLQNGIVRKVACVISGGCQGPIKAVRDPGSSVNYNSKRCVSMHHITGGV